MKSYEVMVRMEYTDDFSEWECFDGFEAEGPDDETFYTAEEYVRDAVEIKAEIAEMMARGDITDFEVKIIDTETGDGVDFEWASCIYPYLYRSEAEDEE